MLKSGDPIAMSDFDQKQTCAAHDAPCAMPIADIERVASMPEVNRQVSGRLYRRSSRTYIENYVERCVGCAAELRKTGFSRDLA
jgi:hypothetical protein